MALLVNCTGNVLTYIYVENSYYKRDLRYNCTFHLQLSTLHLRAEFTLNMQLDAIFGAK